jgi:hypothetical protein
MENGIAGNPFILAQIGEYSSMIKLEPFLTETTIARKRKVAKVW